MRDRNSGVDSERAGIGPSRQAEDRRGRKEIPYDDQTFFESFYKSSREAEITDRTTIGPDFSQMEARFHYNAVENAILRAVTRRHPPPRQGGVLAWEMLVRRRRLRLLDVGSGSGHWIDFFRDTLLVQEAVGVDIAPRIVSFLEDKFRDDDDVTILNRNIASDRFCQEIPAGAFDYISAIGVMFHIVDDDLWRQGLGNLAGLLKPDGLLIVGGDFGSKTRNVQFNTTDSFESWSDYLRAEPDPDAVKVNKRVRSFADWQRAAAEAGLVVLDLVRTDSAAVLRSPENDVLVLGRAEAA